MHAPGVNILSAGLGSDTATAVMTGTSMSAPFAAGVAALYMQNNPVCFHPPTRSICLNTVFVSEVCMQNDPVRLNPLQPSICLTAVFVSLSVLW